VPEPRAFEIEMAMEKLKTHKSPGTDQIPAEMIKAGFRTISSEIHQLINSVWNREDLPEEWKQSIIVLTYKRGIKQNVIIIQVYHFCQVRTKCYPAVKGNFTCR
jgi:hypothetical protein